VRRLGHNLGRKEYDIILIERTGRIFVSRYLHQVAAGSLDANIDEVGYGSHGNRWGYRFFNGALESIDRDAREVIVAPFWMMTEPKLSDGTESAMTISS